MQKENASTTTALTQEAKEQQQILQDQLIERERRLEEKQKNVQDLETSVGVLENNLQVTSDQYRQAQKDIERLQSENSQLNQPIAGLTDKLSSIEKQVSTKQSKLENQEEHIKQVKETYENLLTELDDEITKKEAALQQIEEELRITFVDKILFDFGKAKISTEGQQKLLKVANTLSKIKNKKIRIQGHTDDIPIAREYRYKYPSNWELSAARAASVVRFFIEQGDIKGENMEAVGHAYYKPIATNETPEGRLTNRRVEILITP
jgi:chemotaxis protein MotB